MDEQTATPPRDAVSELQHENAALCESEVRLRSVVAAMTEGIVVQDLNGAIIWWNGSAESILGLTGDQLAGRTSIDPRWGSIREDGTPFPGEQHPAMVTLRSGEAQRDGVMGIRKPDGSLTWISINTQPILDLETRQMRGVVASFSDITLRRQVEQEIRDSRLRAEQAAAEAGKLALIVNRTTNIVILTDAHGRIEWVNEAFTTISGYTPAEVLGRKPGEFLQGPQTDADTVVRMRACLQRGEGFREQIVNYARDGRAYWLDIEVQPLRNKDGRPGGFMAVETDITERKQAEQALRDSAARIRGILDTVIDAIITIDERGIIESFNPAAERIFEYRAQEVIGRNVNLLMPEPYHSAHDGYVTHYLRTSERRVIGIGREVQGRRKSGTTFPMELAVSELQLDGRRNFVGVARDITERKRLDRMKSEFVSAVSHELRTPMNAILGFTQLLGYDDNLTEKQRANLVKVRKAGEHLLNLVNDVLDLSRIEAGKVTLSIEPVALTAVLRECRNLAQTMADTRGVRLIIDSEGAADYCVRADRTRLRQVVLNLISNAVKYNRNGGTVWVNCTTDIADRVRIAVRDNGPGIPVERQAELFQPFNRLGAERGEVEGTGIGLTISKQLVELMGGAIAFRSSAGEGTTFMVEFAAGSAARASDAVAQSGNTNELPRTRDGAYNVLYVEDNPANLELVQALLAQFWPKLRLITATTAEVGLDLAVNQRPDVILLDINLPGIDGYEALARLRNDPLTAAIPVVAVTANAMKDSVERGLAAGFNAYVTKPLDIPRFLAVLDGMFAGLMPAVRADCILVADDTLVNQEVARGMLETLGYRVDVVTDGRAAVEAAQRTRYAAILMDCQMPVMDGYEATAAIRNLEGIAQHTPIIAVTAHAPGEDRAPRADAGLDDYLTKPLNLDLLKATLQCWARREPSPPASDASRAADVAVLDASATRQLRSVLGARAVPVLDALLADIPLRLAAMKAAVAANDCAAVRSEAHTIKGSCSNVGASEVVRLCGEMSECCKNGTAERLPQLYQALEREYQERVRAALEQFRESLLRGDSAR